MWWRGRQRYRQQRGWGNSSQQPSRRQTTSQTLSAQMCGKCWWWKAGKLLDQLKYHHWRKPWREDRQRAHKTPGIQRHYWFQVWIFENNWVQQFFNVATIPLSTFSSSFSTAGVSIREFLGMKILLPWLPFFPSYPQWRHSFACWIREHCHSGCRYHKKILNFKSSFLSATKKVITLKLFILEQVEKL